MIVELHADFPVGKSYQSKHLNADILFRLLLDHLFLQWYALKGACTTLQGYEFYPYHGIIFLFIFVQFRFRNRKDLP